MGSYIGPEISNAGLVLSIDAGNIKSFRGLYNTANLAPWVFGTGGISSWSNNGTTAENQRIANTNPLGVMSCVWDTPSNDVDSGADGGFNSTSWEIDPTYYYRFSCWIKRPIVGNGSTYLGLYGIDSVGTNIGVLTRSGGASTTNPYFFATSWAWDNNRWYLFVGHVHPLGSGTGANHPESGVYDTSGTRVSTSVNDYVWQDGNVRSMIRSYLYYSTDTTTAQCWWQPRIDKMDGTEPSIAELVNGVGGRLIDLSKSGATVALANGVENQYATGSFPALNFNGTNSHIIISDLYNFSGTNKLTAAIWVKSNQANWNDTGMIFSRRSQFIMHPAASSKVINFYVYTTTWEQITGTPDDITKWNHIVMTYDAGALKAYINGVLVNSGSVGTTLASSTSPTHIGFDDSGARFLDGSVSMAHCWNRALSADEVARLFNATRGRHGV